MSGYFISLTSASKVGSAFNHAYFSQHTPTASGKLCDFSKIMKLVKRVAEEYFLLIYIIFHIFFYNLCRRHAYNV
jgi:hypothetical protein